MRRVLVALLLVVACGDNTRPESEWPFPLPEGFPVPRLPEGARLTPELAELGRYLFYDPRLSGTGTQSCSSCHEQARAFTDGRVTPLGSTGAVLERNAMSLTNAAYNSTQTWASDVLVHLEQQARVPMLGTDPIELGITGNEDVVLARLREDPAYQAMYAAAFPGATEPLDLDRVVLAIAAFERRLISGDAPIDRHRRGELVLSDAALRGEALFSSDRLRCDRCHGGFNFTAAIDHAELAAPRVAFFNNGLYNVGDTGAYPETDQGLYDLTGIDADRGRFRPPTLRNILVTAPYMHDGSVATLRDVLEIYERGGRDVATGPNAGDGKYNPHKSELLEGFFLTGQEHGDLDAFFEALTDQTFLTDPALASPFAP